ncbi:MAG TPA: hypothetical protein VG477_09390 [Thermoanaerobaculia bacterium]|nr:hypothetical protein [Thermoanaerobaculia bacterium]
MDEKKIKDGLDRLEEVEVSELTDKDLDSVAGGNETDLVAEGPCNSSWCCSNGGG